MICLFDKYENLEGGEITFYWGHQEKFHEGGNISMDLKCVKFWLAELGVQEESRSQGWERWGQLCEHWVANAYFEKSSMGLIAIMKSTMDL